MRSDISASMQDLIDQDDAMRRTGMPTVSRFEGIRIFMNYGGEHPPPHFHAEYQGSIAVYRISPPGWIKGIMPPQQESKILDWAARRQTELMDAWDLAAAHLPPGRIDP